MKMVYKWSALRGRMGLIAASCVSVFVMQGCTQEPTTTTNPETTDQAPISAPAARATMAPSTTMTTSATPSPEPTPGAISSTDTISSPETMPSAAPSPASELQEQYTLKVVFSTAVPATFDVKINGDPAGSFTANSEQDITPLLKPGKNSVTIHTVPGEVKRQSKYLDSKLTVGVNRGGKWSTVITHTVKTDSTETTKSYTIVAK